MEYHDPSINNAIRKLQPKAIINNRGCDEGDSGTPERESEFALAETEPLLRFPRPTEAVNSIGVESWGYRKDEDYYSVHHLIDSIDKILAKGGNYLLNVGPEASGRIPQGAAILLRRIGSWYNKVKESFEGAEPATELLGGPGLYLTRRGNKTLYVHFYGLPYSDAVLLPFIKPLLRRATLLNTGKPVEFCIDPNHPRYCMRNEKVLKLHHLPVNDFANEVMVVRLDFDEPVNRSDEKPIKPFFE